MTKRLICLVLVLCMLVAIMVFTLAACGGSGNKQAIIGTWKLVDEATQTEYGLGIQFTKDGKLRYGLTADDLTSLTGDEDVDKALSYLMSIEYKIKSDTEMEVTVSALLGLKKESSTVAYTLDGDTLEFDGVTYIKVK